MPGKERTVLVGLTAELATAPVLPGGAALRWVTADEGMHRIAALQSTVWGQDWNWLGENLIARIAAAPQGIAVLAAEAAGDVVSAGWLAARQTRMTRAAEPDLTSTARPRAVR